MSLWTDQTLKSQLVQDANTPVWAADTSKSGNPRAFIPVTPSHQQRFSLDSYNWGKLVGLAGDLIPSAALLGGTGADALKAAIRQLNAQLGQWLSGALVYADTKTAFPPGVGPWQKDQGNSTFADPSASSDATGLLPNQQFLFYDQQPLTRYFLPSNSVLALMVRGFRSHLSYP